MKARLLLCMLIALVLGLLACSPAPSGASVEISCDEFMKMSSRPAIINKDIQVPANGTVTVTLCSNASTGYRWQEKAQIADQKILQQTDHKAIAPTASMPGAPGKEVWTFKALKNGTTSVSMEYGQPWAGGNKGDWKFNLTVTVE